MFSNFFSFSRVYGNISQLCLPKRGSWMLGAFLFGAMAAFLTHLVVILLSQEVFWGHRVPESQIHLSTFSTRTIQSGCGKYNNSKSEREAFFWCILIYKRNDPLKEWGGKEVAICQPWYFRNQGVNLGLSNRQTWDDKISLLTQPLRDGLLLLCLSLKATWASSKMGFVYFWHILFKCTALEYMSTIAFFPEAVNV